MSLLLLKFLFLVLFLSKPGSPASACSTYLITQQFLGCTGGTRTFAGSSFNLKKTKELSIALTIRPTSLCSVPQDFNFLVVSIFPTSRSNLQTKVITMTYHGSQNSIAFHSQDVNGMQSTTLFPVTFLNKPMNLYVVINLSTGSSTFSGGGTLEQVIDIFPATVSYGSDWVFGPGTQIDVCSDSGINCIACNVQNLKVSSSSYTLAGYLDLANSVTLIGDYKMKDGNGVPQTNSQGILGPTIDSSLFAPGYFLPGWNKETGLEFTASNQLIQLPGFQPVAPDLSITASVGFAFYMTIDAIPTANKYIFYYRCTDPNVQNNIWSLQITPSMKLGAQMESAYAEGSLTLNIGEWYWIYVSYVYTAGKVGASVVYVNGARIGLEPYVTNAQGALRLSSSDYVRVGAGFTGKLRSMQVYSPAAAHLNPSPLFYLPLPLKLMIEPCDSITCQIDMGFDNPPTCIHPICDTPGYYPLIGTCERCPSRCKTCTDPTTCQRCQPGYGFYNSNLCVLCPAGTYRDSTTHICKKLSKTLQNILTDSQLISSAATQAANLLSKGSSISLSAMIGGKIFSQIKYLNISYSGELQVALLTWLTSFVSLGLTPDLPESIAEKFPQRPVPYVFQKYDVGSSFLINFWENLGILMFATFLWVLFKGLESFLDGKRASLSRKIRIMVQNFLIAALCGIYGDVIMFALIEYRSLTFGWNLSLLSFFLSVVLIIIMFFTFLYQVKLLFSYQKLKKQSPENLKKFKTSNEGNQVLFKDFKDYSISTQLFPFFLSGRDIIFSLLLATMFEYPLAQTLIIILLDCLMIVYLFIKKPFESTFDFVQQLFFEFLGLIASVTVSINAILDTGKYENFQARYNIGKLVIIANLIFNFVTAVFMFIIIVQTLLEFYKQQKQNQAKKLNAPTLQKRLPRPLDESIQKNKLINSNSEQSLIQETSKNDIEMISLQQSFDQSREFPSQTQSNTQLRRRINKNPQKRFQNRLNQRQVPTLIQNQEFQPRANLRRSQNPLPGDQQA